MKVEIDRAGCIGCGACASVCPKVFRMADDGLSEVYAQPKDKETEKLAKAARDDCPVSVIDI